VAEEGTHEELIAHRGLYYELCVIQGTVEPDELGTVITPL